MRIRVALILDMLHALALALWLGGLVTLVGVAFPAARASADPRPFALPLVQNFGTVAELCGLVTVGVHFVLRRRYQRSRPHFIADGVRQLLAFGAFFLAEFVRYSLLSAMTRSEGTQFLSLLNTYINLATVQIVLLIGVTGISAWLTLPPPRTATTPAVETPTAPPAKPAPASTKKTKR